MTLRCRATGGMYPLLMAEPPVQSSESAAPPSVSAPPLPGKPDRPETGNGVEAQVREDPLSAMTPRFNLLFRYFAHRFFRHFDLDDATVSRLRELEERGTVVYVMRYASRLDYFLFNALFAREGLRLSAFANGLSFYYYAPMREAIGDRPWRRRSAFQPSSAW